MTSLLQQFIHKGTITLKSGESYLVDDSITVKEGRFIQSIIKKIKPKVTIEVGLASGISSLFILEAIKKNGGQKLIGIDPSQFSKHMDTRTLTHGNYYYGRGLEVIERSGFKNSYEFYNNTSQQVLPDLVRRNTHIRFAFVDGWHTFDHALVDFFYLDQMMEIGGTIAFHDSNWPAIHNVSAFIELNRRYKKYLIPQKFGDINIVAFTKIGNDDRNYDHFVPFTEKISLFNFLKKKIQKNLSQ